jgi:hypothetical protein
MGPQLPPSPRIPRIPASAVLPVPRGFMLLLAPVLVATLAVTVVSAGDVALRGCGGPALGASESESGSAKSAARELELPAVVSVAPPYSNLNPPTQAAVATATSTTSGTPFPSGIVVAEPGASGQRVDLLDYQARPHVRTTGTAAHHDDEGLRIGGVFCFGCWSAVRGSNSHGGEVIN